MSTPVTEQAAALQVEATSRALHLPTVRQQASALAEARCATGSPISPTSPRCSQPNSTTAMRAAVNAVSTRLHFPRLKHLADFDLKAAPTVDPAMLATLERASGSTRASPSCCSEIAAPASRTC